MIKQVLGVYKNTMLIDKVSLANNEVKRSIMRNMWCTSGSVPT